MEEHAINPNENNDWKYSFIFKGGFTHLLDLFKILLKKDYTSLDLIEKKLFLEIIKIM